MNFTPFWSVDKHSDLLYVHPSFLRLPSTSLTILLTAYNLSHCSFWTIAIPVMAFLIPIFMLDEIRKGVRYLQRRYDTRQAVRYHNGR